MQYTWDIFFQNSEYLENIEGMFPQYYMYSDVYQIQINNHMIMCYPLWILKKCKR